MEIVKTDILKIIKIVEILFLDEILTSKILNS